MKEKCTQLDGCAMRANQQSQPELELRFGYGLRNWPDSSIAV